MELTYICPVLRDTSKYLPDSLDLSADPEAREYWLQCFEELVQRFVNKAEYLHPGDSTAKSRAEDCRIRYVQMLNSLRTDPLLLGPDPLSVRILLDINEQYLRENGFTDAWKLQKQTENREALQQLSNRLKEIDNITDQRLKWEELCRGLLAGNMFDWGARAVTDLFENSCIFGLSQALLKIEPRPWLVDHLELWLERLEKKVHKCAAIFVDNAGIDLVLGVFPIARELLHRGTNVLLCANSTPALNDVTYPELVASVTEAGTHCPVIKEAFLSNKLKCFETGQHGPCLDLRNLHKELCFAMANIDLVIFEGMGRALHTNLYAKLSVDCLKMAVIKNEWLANKLGGKKFSVLCQFEPVSMS